MMVDGSCGLACSFNRCPPFSHVADYVDDGSVMTLWMISTRKIDTPTPSIFPSFRDACVEVKG